MTNHVSIKKFSNVDHCDVYISGWAFDFEESTLNCAIDIYINNYKRGTVFTGTDERVDVGPYLESTERIPNDLRRAYGFKVMVQEWLLPGENKIEVRFNSDSSTLTNGIQIYQYSPNTIEVIKGPEGFLIQVDTNYTLVENLAGSIPLNPIRLEDAAQQLIVTAHLLKGLGVLFDASICPERLCFLSEETSGQYLITNERRAVQVASAVEKWGAPLTYEYEVLQKYPQDFVARKTDTHLTPRACKILADRIMKRLFTSHWTDEDEDWGWHTRNESGDLGHLIEPPEKELLEHPNQPESIYEVFDTRHSRLVWDLAGHAAAWVNGDASHDSIVVFGTSSSQLVSIFLRRFFRTVINVWSNSIDIDLIESIRPTACIVILTEKTLSDALIRRDMTVKPEARKRIELAVAMMRQNLSKPDV